MRHLIFREAMQSTTLGHAIGSFCVRLLSMSCQIVVCFNHKGSFISIINTRYASNATSERGTQTGIDPATFETEGKSRNHSATTRPPRVLLELSSGTRLLPNCACCFDMPISQVSFSSLLLLFISILDNVYFCRESVWLFPLP